MRIARFAVAGGDPRFGIVELEADEGQFPDTIAVIDGDPLAGPVNYTGERIALDDARLLAPVIPRSKILAIGKNYAAHAAEFDGEVPPEPLIFMKPNTSVIGRFCRKVPVERAAEVIFGYTVANDVTARDLQRSDGQWTRAKGFDTFCPLGPWSVTHLGIDEAADLSLVTSVDGEVKQDANTNQMVYSIAELIAYVSAFATLLPGDVLLTGTPAGVGPLLAGQRVSVEIDGIGTLTNPVVDDTDDLEDADSVAAK